MNLDKKEYIKKLVSIASFIFVIAGYIWFITYGYWTNWNPSTYFYDNLATAFSHRSLSLEIEVSPKLLALENPYNPFERKGIDFPLDYSLYNGKYYLYFGPIPALMLAALKLIGVGAVGDHLLVFIFTCMLFVFEIATIIFIKKHFFQAVPNWVAPFYIIFIGLASPIAWMLTEARVYEAAIIAGQAFFVAGFYFTVTAISQNTPSSKRLFFGGILFAFAFGSRLTLILPIGFVVSLVFVLLLHRSYPWKSVKQTTYQLLSPCVPIVIGGLLFAWYNWARFGSVFETGIYYQLTTKYLQKFSEVLFSPIYILPNAYEYLFGKPKLLSSFPYFQPVRARGALHFPFLNLPAVYWTSAVTGIFYNTPFVIFAGMPILSNIIQTIKKEKLKDNLINWIHFALLGSGLAGFFTVTSFFWVAGRYFADFTPSFILLSVIGFFIGYYFFSHKPKIAFVYLIVGTTLMLTSTVISNLLVFGFRSATYQDWNPVLWNQLYNFFTP